MNQKTRKTLSALLVMLLVCSFAVTALAESAMATQNAYVYNAPSEETAYVVGMLEAGDHVSVNFAQGNWTDITIGNLTGYVLSSKLIPAIENTVPVISNPVPVIQQPDPIPVIPNPGPVPVIQQPDPVPVPVIINPVPVVDSGSSTNMYTTTKLNVRSGPSTKYGKIGVLRQGAPVMVLGKTGTWYKINYNGLVGYVCAKYVQQGNATYGGYLTALNKQMMTNAPVTVYKGTGAQYGEMGAFPAGYLAHVVASCGGWYKVVFGNSYGYVQRAYLSDVCYAY